MQGGSAVDVQQQPTCRRRTACCCRCRRGVRPLGCGPAACCAHEGQEGAESVPAASGLRLVLVGPAVGKVSDGLHACLLAREMLGPISSAEHPANEETDGGCQLKLAAGTPRQSKFPLRLTHCTRQIAPVNLQQRRTMRGVLGCCLLLAVALSALPAADALAWRLFAGRWVDGGVPPARLAHIQWGRSEPLAHALPLSSCREECITELMPEYQVRSASAGPAGRSRVASRAARAVAAAAWHCCAPAVGDQTVGRSSPCCAVGDGAAQGEDARAHARAG